MFKSLHIADYINSDLPQNSDGFSADFVLSKALNIAEAILKSGGEPHRIEDTVERICLAYGAASADVFALPSLIIAGIRMPDGTHSTQMRRVLKNENNMFRLDLANDISRKVCSFEIPLTDVDEKLKDIAEKEPYNPLWLYVGSILAAGGFAVFFGGTIIDCFAAMICGCFVTLLNRHRIKFINPLIHTVITSFIAGIVALLLIKFGIGDNTDMVMIGTIMLLIPGLSFGNAIRDLMFGDIISGIFQFVQATLIAVMVAFGFAAAGFVFGGVIV